MTTAPTIEELATARVAGLNGRSLYRAVARLIQERMPDGFISVGLADQARLELQRVFGVAPSGELAGPGLRLAFGEGVVGTAALRLAPVVVPDVDAIENYVRIFEGTRSELAVPVLGPTGAVLGFLDVESKQVDRFGREEEDFLRRLAVVFATALVEQKSRTGDPLALERLELMHRVGRIVTSTFDLEELLRLLTEELRRALGFDLVGIGLLDEGSSTLRLRAISSRLPSEIAVGFEQPAGVGVAGEVVATGAPIVVEDVRRVEGYLPARPDVVSEICVPVRAGDQILGYLNVESVVPGDLGPDDAPLLVALGEMLGRVVANLRALAQRERARAELSAMLVHELRSPAAALSFNLEVLDRWLSTRTEPGDTVLPRECVKEAQVATQALARLVDGILSVTNMEAGTLELNVSTVSIAELLDRALGPVTPVASLRGVTLRRALLDPGPLEADAALLARALESLVGYAVKHSPKGAEVEVAVRPAPPALVEERLPEARAAALLEVTGGSPGLSDAELGRLFVAAPGGGSLGLVLCQMVIDAHGGDAWAERTRGNLPLARVMIPRSLANLPSPGVSP